MQQTVMERKTIQNIKV